MQLISLKKRLIYYLALLPVTLIMANVVSMITFVMKEDDGYVGIPSYIIFFLLHYIFAAIVLKTKFMNKIIVALATTLASFGILYLILTLGIYDIYLMVFFKIADCLIQVFVIAGIWELTYQIGGIMHNARMKNRN